MQHHLLRQLHDRLGFIIHPVRMHTSDRVLDGFLHLEVCQVLPVDDVDIVIRTSGFMKLDRVAIPLKFTAEGIQHGSIHAAQTVTEGRWNAQRKGCSGFHIRPDIKRTVESRMAFQPLHCPATSGH